ncbi:hypothetical protein ACLB2K_002075 [Fragaria x ananassa]
MDLPLVSTRKRIWKPYMSQERDDWLQTAQSDGESRWKSIVSYLPIKIPLFMLVELCYSYHSWKKPAIGWYKLNIDGSRNSSSGKIGAAGTIRDHPGSWISGFQINLGIDSAILVQLLQMNDCGLHPLGSLIAGCLNLITKFNIAKISRILEKETWLLMLLPKIASNHSFGLVLFDNPPIHAAQSYLDDISAMSRARRCYTYNA